MWELVKSDCLSHLRWTQEVRRTGGDEFGHGLPCPFTGSLYFCTPVKCWSMRLHSVGRRPSSPFLIDRIICLDRYNGLVRDSFVIVILSPRGRPQESWDFVAEVPRAAALLHPLRLRILHELREPDSAAGLARRFRLPRQKINYHVRALARAHFLERAGQRRRRNMIERRYRTTAQGYILSPELLGRLGVPREQAEDAFSAAHLLGLLSLGQAELGRARREASAQDKRLATLSMNTELRFESAEQRARFTADLQQAVVEVTARHASPFTRGDGVPAPGRPYRLILGCYPIPPKVPDDNDEGGKSR
jgi:DNA-binding transcriptional ArsR family regulator